MSVQGRQRTPNEDSPASAFLKNWISEIPPPHPSPAVRTIPARIAAPGRQILGFSSRFPLGIPTPIPAQRAAPRLNLEHVTAGPNPGFPDFQNFGGAKVKPHEHTDQYSSHPRAEHRRKSFRFRHLVMGRRRGSGSVRVRVQFRVD